MRRFLQAGMLPPQERYISWISYFDKRTKRDFFDSDITQSLEHIRTPSIHEEYFQAVTSADFLDHISYLDITTYLPDDLLIMADRMSMAHSLELRVPLCDNRLLELSAEIPSRLKYQGFHLKALFKAALEGILPDKVLHKKKQGFMVPVGRWIKEDLRDYVQDALSPSEIKKMGYFSSTFVEKMLKEHFSGKKVLSHQIWALLIFKLWHKRFIEDARG